MEGRAGMGKNNTAAAQRAGPHDVLADEHQPGQHRQRGYRWEDPRSHPARQQPEVTRPGKPAGAAGAPVQPAYRSSMTSAYLACTTRRLSFMVGVSSSLSAVHSV